MPVTNDYQTKQNAILAKLKETDYELFGGRKDEALDQLADCLESFPTYANVIIREQIMIPIWHQRYEGADFREAVQGLDHTRRIMHDGAVTNLNILNRMSNALGLEPFADIDTKDRYAVADFVGQYVNEMYNNGAKGGLDEAVKNKTAEYDAKAIHARIKEADAMMASVQKQGESAAYEP